MFFSGFKSKMIGFAEIKFTSNQYAETLKAYAFLNLLLFLSNQVPMTANRCLQKIENYGTMKRKKEESYIRVGILMFKRIVGGFFIFLTLLCLILSVGCGKDTQENGTGVWTVVKQPGYKEKGELRRSGSSKDGSSMETIRIYASKGLSYTEEDGKIFVSGIGSFKGNFLYISSKTPDGKKVSGIARSAFLDNEKIEHLYIEDGVSEIGLCAFAGCTNLQNARFPEEVSLFEDSIFISCQRLGDVSLPSNLTEIPLSCFDGCTSLVHVSLPEGLVSIGYSAFNLCISLESLVLPDSVVQISANAFADCTGLQSLELSDSLKYLNDSAFSNCTSLTEVTLPNTLEFLGDYAFFHCKNLTSVHVSKNLLRIEGTPFYQSNPDLVISTDAGEPLEGWSENFNCYFEPEVESDEIKAYNLTVRYGK